MTSKELFECINLIDDKLIIHADVKGLKKNRIKICTSIAACLILVIGVTSFVGVSKINIINDNPMIKETTIGVDSIEAGMLTIECNGYIYEVDINRTFTEKNKLPLVIDESMIGEVIKSKIKLDDWLKQEKQKYATVYTFTGVSDESVIILKTDEGEYFYAYKCEE